MFACVIFFLFFFFNDQSENNYLSIYWTNFRNMFVSPLFTRATLLCRASYMLGILFSEVSAI